MDWCPHPFLLELHIPALVWVVLHGLSQLGMALLCTRRKWQDKGTATSLASGLQSALQAWRCVFTAGPELISSCPHVHGEAEGWELLACEKYQGGQCRVFHLLMSCTMPG